MDTAIHGRNYVIAAQDPKPHYSDVPEENGIVYAFDIEEWGVKVAEIGYLVLPHGVMFTFDIQRATPSLVKFIRHHANHNCVQVLDHFGFDEIYYHTNNKGLAKMLTYGNVEKADYPPVYGKDIYVYHPFHRSAA